jgi:hypothetical protein
MKLATASCTGSFGLVLLLRCASRVGRLQYRADGHPIRPSIEFCLQCDIIALRGTRSIIASSARKEEMKN